MSEPTLLLLEPVPCILFWAYSDQASSTITTCSTIHILKWAISVITTIVIIVLRGSRLLTPEKSFSILTPGFGVCRLSWFNKSILYSRHQFFMVSKITTPPAIIWATAFSIFSCVIRLIVLTSILSHMCNSFCTAVKGPFIFRVSVVIIVFIIPWRFFC